MKVRLMAALMSVSLLAPVCATSLKLSSDIDLLVLDGKRISGAILKGAESLEVDAGQHQILFQVSKNLHPATMNALMYHSPAMIVSFSAKGIRSASFILPTLNNEMDAAFFSRKLNYRLVDQDGRDIPSRRDVLRQVVYGNATDLEKVMLRYNLSGLRASVPAFATAVQQRDSSLFTTTSLSMLNVSSQKHSSPGKTSWPKLVASPHVGRFFSWFSFPSS